MVDTYAETEVYDNLSQCSLDIFSQCSQETQIYTEGVYVPGRPSSSGAIAASTAKLCVRPAGSTHHLWSIVSVACAGVARQIRLYNLVLAWLRVVKLLNGREARRELCPSYARGHKARSGMHGLRVKVGTLSKDHRKLREQSDALNKERQELADTCVVLAVACCGRRGLACLRL